MTWMCDSHIPCIAHIPHIPSPSHVGPMRTWQQMCGILTPSVCDLKFQISGTTSPIDSQHMAWMMIWIYRSFPSAMQWVVKSEHNQNTLFWTWVWWDRWNPRFFGSTWNSENVGTFWPIDLFVLLFDLCAFVRCLSLTNLTKLIVTGCECLPGGLEARSDPKTCYTRRWRYKMDVFQTLFPWVWMIYMVWSTVGFKLIWLFHALFCGFVSVCFFQLRSVATDLGCSLILANTDPNVLLQMEQFRLPLVNLEVEEKKLKKSTSLLVAKTLEQAFFGKKGGRLGIIGISPSRNIFCNFFHPLNTCSGRNANFCGRPLSLWRRPFWRSTSRHQDIAVGTRILASSTMAAYRLLHGCCRYSGCL